MSSNPSEPLTEPLSAGNDFTQLAHELLFAHRYLTPFVMMDREALVGAVRRFKKHLPGVRFKYAIKANCAPGIIACFRDEGLGFDAASANEIDLALSLGVPASDLILSHPVKDTRTCHSMLRNRIPVFAVDNISELQKISRIPRDYVPDVLIRIRTESEDVEHDLNDKFGCRLKDAPELAAKARDLGFNPTGLTFHVGTQSYLASNYQRAFDHCTLVAELTKGRYGITLNHINMGGGFCDEDVARRNGTTVDRVLAEIGNVATRVQGKGFTVIAEPGRALVAQSGTLITQVIGVHDRGPLRIVHIDDGVYGTLTAQIYENRKYQLTVLPRTASREPFSTATKLTRVCGRTCDSIDTLTEAQPLPADLQVGDYLFVRNVGAYGFVCGSMFNGFDFASSILYSNTERSLEVHEASQPLVRVAIHGTEAEQHSDEAAVG